MPSQPDALLLIGHGTVADETELRAFLTRIRAGREPSAGLLQDIASRYARIGGSPLLAISQAQARALQSALGIPCLLAMRLWHPLVEDVVEQAVAAGQRRLLLLPLAPFSVEVYFRAAQRAVAERGLTQVELVSVAPWGEHPRFVAAWVEQIRPLCEQFADARLVLTAHSLPTHVIAAGDGYQREVSACAQAIAQSLGREHLLAFQSQGADGGSWLGPTLPETFAQLARSAVHRVIVAPIGFLSDHVETLYDLDVEAKAQAQEQGLDLIRVKALNDSPLLIEAMAAVAREAQ